MRKLRKEEEVDRKERDEAIGKARSELLQKTVELEDDRAEASGDVR
jgi:hypothetical protein